MEKIRFQRYLVHALIVALTVFMLVMPVAPGSARDLKTSTDFSTFVDVQTLIDPTTLDPALAYDTQSAHILRQVYDTLVFYDREDATAYIPMLAEDWTVSPDGLTYTFYIRQGVQFHNGGSLTPSDVAYSLQRGILQGGTNSPQWLLTEPLFGIGITDVTLLVDPGGSLFNDRSALQAWDAGDLLAACTTVQNAIVADDGNGTVTLHLAQAWDPMLGTLASPMASIMDEGWTVANGGWDDDCNTWQNFYFMEPGSDPFTGMVNGTGPFFLEYWDPGVEISLLRNEDYWRQASDPMWADGPGGLAAFVQVLIQQEGDDSVRYARLAGGTADTADGLAGYYGALDSLSGPGGILTRYDGTTQPLGTDASFNYQIGTGVHDSYIGSGSWDGNGIPADFFSDVNVRRAFSYAFDYDQFLSDVYGGDAMRRRGPIPAGLTGYSDGSLIYETNASTAAIKMAEAWGGAVLSNGFTFKLAYNSGNVFRQTLANRIKTDIEALNPSLYHIEVIELSWPDYVDEIGAGSLPIYYIGWQGDIAHPHNWVVPYMTGYYAQSQSVPPAERDAYAVMINACLSTSGVAAQLCYEGIQDQAIADAIDLFLAQPSARIYLRSEVSGYFFNAYLNGMYYYALTEHPLAEPDDPSTFVEVRPLIDPSTLDPARAYDTTSGHILRQVYDTLLFYDREDALAYIPMLATDWTISPDGLTYTFDIRRNVQFHNGELLTPSDVAYSLQRGILQGGSGSPQWLLDEPLFGVGIVDVTYLVDPSGSLVDDRSALQAWDPGDLLAACTTVQNAIVADDGNWTITLHLAQAWDPLLGTLAHTVASIMDEGWTAANGGWDGDCNTWQNYYFDPGSDPFNDMVNGTGPFALDYWDPGVEISMLRNENYWRPAAEPMWQGVPGGPAAFEQVMIIQVESEYARYHWLTSGAADYADSLRDYYDVLDTEVLFEYDQPDGLTATLVDLGGVLKRYNGYTQPVAQDASFNYDINTGGARNYTGSGTWDGYGIPYDFFSDVHARRAFSYAFDYNQFIADYFGGEADLRRGPIPAGLAGYLETSPVNEYDPSAAITEFNLAWSGHPATDGFTLTLAYNTGNAFRETLAYRIKADIETLNPAKYHIDVVELPWSEYVEDQFNHSLPIYYVGWLADIPHPHNWVTAYMSGYFAQMQQIPQADRDTYQGMIDTCLPLSGSAAQACYEDLQYEAITDAIDLFIAQPYTRLYLRAEVRGDYDNPYLGGLYFYALSKGGLLWIDSATPGGSFVVDFDLGSASSASLDMPTGAVDDEYVIVITPDTRSFGSLFSLGFGDLVFDIQAFHEGTQVDGLALLNPVTITLSYDEADIIPVVEEDLYLYYWNGSGWEDAACGPYVRNLVGNTLQVPICHFSQFALVGGQYHGFLPVLIR